MLTALEVSCVMKLKGSDCKKSLEVSHQHVWWLRILNTSMRAPETMMAELLVIYSSLIDFWIWKMIATDEFWIHSKEDVQRWRLLSWIQKGAHRWCVSWFPRINLVYFVLCREFTGLRQIRIFSETLMPAAASFCLVQCYRTAAQRYVIRRILVLRLESGTRTLLSWTTCCKRLVGCCDESWWDLANAGIALPALSGSWQSPPISGPWCFITIVGCLADGCFSGLQGVDFSPRNALAKFGLRDELLCRSLLPPLLRRITEKSKWEEIPKTLQGNPGKWDDLGHFRNYFDSKVCFWNKTWIQWILTKLMKDVDGRNPALWMYETLIIRTPNQHFFQQDVIRLGIFPCKHPNPLYNSPKNTFFKTQPNTPKNELNQLSHELNQRTYLSWHCLLLAYQIQPLSKSSIKSSDPWHHAAGQKGPCLGHIAGPVLDLFWVWQKIGNRETLEISQKKRG